MKSNIKVLYSNLILFILFSTGCEVEINLSLKKTAQKLVVEGNILSGLDTIIQEQEIKLTLPADYTGNALPKPVSNAIVKVVEGSNTYNFNHVGEGVYKSNFIAGVNKTYKLIITYDNNTYEATETIRTGPTIDELTVNYFPSALGSPEGDFISINTKDPVGERNFYLWRLFINNHLMINPSPGNIYRVIQKDDFFNGQPLKNYLAFDNFPVVEGDNVRMEQLSISEQMYNYYYAIFNLTASSPVSGDVPPGKIKGNIINITSPDENALGYFGACSVSIKTKRL